MAYRFSVREKVLIGGLAAVGLIYLVYMAVRGDTASDLGAIGASEKVESLADTAPRVPMDLLAKGAESYDPRGRDLFKYTTCPPTPEERARQERQAVMRKKAEEARRKAAESRPPPVPPPAPPVKREPQPPGINLKYLGYLGPKTNKIAFFRDGQDMVMARVGEVVLDEFRLVEIRYQTVVMGYTDPKWESRTTELPMTRN